MEEKWVRNVAATRQIKPQYLSDPDQVDIRGVLGDMGKRRRNSSSGADGDDCERARMLAEFLGCKHARLTLLVGVMHVHEAGRVHTANVEALRGVTGSRFTDERVGPVSGLANDERELGPAGVRVVRESDGERMPLPPVARDTSKGAVSESRLAGELDDRDALVSNDLDLGLGDLLRICKKKVKCTS